MINLQLYSVVMIAETFLFTEIKEKYYSLVIISHHSGETPIDFRVKRLRSQIRVVNIHVCPQICFRLKTPVWIIQAQHMYHSTLWKIPIDFWSQQVKSKGHRSA